MSPGYSYAPDSRFSVVLAPPLLQICRLYLKPLNLAVIFLTTHNLSFIPLVHKPNKENQKTMAKTDKRKQSYIEESSPPCHEDDEINILDIFIVLLKHKKLIFLTVFAAGLFAIVISLMAPNIYRSEATLALRAEDNNSTSIPGLGGIGGMVAGRFGIGANNGLEKLKITLKSRELTRRVVEKHELMPKLFENSWDIEKKKWHNPENVPTIQDAFRLILNSLLTVNINDDSKTITLGFKNKSPDFSKNMVEYYITELSNVLREEVLSDAGEKKIFFNKQLESITDPLLREKNL